MNSENSPQLAIEPASADLAIRIGFCVFGLLFSYFSFRFSMSIGRFELIFSDMLGGKPLPYFTQFILQTKFLWTSISLICAFAPFGFAFAVRKTSLALYGIAACSAIQVIQIILLWTALTAPLLAIINAMSSNL